MSFWSTRKPKKPKPELPGGDLPEFDDNFLLLLQQLTQKAGVQTGWPLYRRGGSYRNWWDASPENNYVPVGFTQIGVYEWTGGASTYINEIITLPKAYDGHFLNWTSVIFQDPEYIWTSCCGIWVDDQTLRIVTWAASNIVHVRVAWMTMGPGVGA